MEPYGQGKKGEIYFYDYSLFPRLVVFSQYDYGQWTRKGIPGPLSYGGNLF